MYILAIAASAMLSADTVAEIVEMVQDDVFIEQIEITPPDPEAIAFLRPSTDNIENICLEYLYEYPNTGTPMHQTGRSDARTQYETVSKTVEYYQGKNPYARQKMGEQYGSPSRKSPEESWKIKTKHVNVGIRSTIFPCDKNRTSKLWLVGPVYKG